MDYQIFTLLLVFHGFIQQIVLKSNQLGSCLPSHVLFVLFIELFISVKCGSSFDLHLLQLLS